jgi:hypothetical protein
LLTTLLQLDGNLRQTVSELQEHGTETDDGEKLVLLSREQVVSIFQRFISDEISGDDLYVWADALELRGDVDFGGDNDDGTLFDVVADISTTYVLRGAITKKEAEEYIQEIVVSMQMQGA